MIHMPAKFSVQSQKINKELIALGLFIKSHRKSHKITSQNAAEAAGISRMTLYRIERGDSSVTWGAYLSVLDALGLQIQIRSKNQIEKKKDQTLSPVKVSDYKVLKGLAWQLKDDAKISPKEALQIYERNWRHVQESALTQKEKKLIQSLLSMYGSEKLLV